MSTLPFDYELPERLIAQQPLKDRASSRLLVCHRDGRLEHQSFRDLPRFLRSVDVIVLNETRVTARRHDAVRGTGGKIELTVLHGSAGLYEALAKPAKKLHPGDVLTLAGGTSAAVAKHLGEGRVILEFADGVDPLGFGSIPTPPYVKQELSDESQYQTVYAAAGGSAAAPTAGLHFDRQLMESVRATGASVVSVNLSIGLDTFRPVATETLEEHAMHGETCTVSEATARTVEQCQGRLIAVGTTSVRTIETFSEGRRSLAAGTRETRLFIMPGYQFHNIDAIVTNFHVPRSTMLSMLEAFMGRERLSAAYEEAKKEQYRFLSFGDAMLVF